MSYYDIMNIGNYVIYIGIDSLHIKICINFQIHLLLTRCLHFCVAVHRSSTQKCGDRYDYLLFALGLDTIRRILYVSLMLLFLLLLMASSDC